MGQIVGTFSNIFRCNLRAIQSGGTKANVVLDEDEVWLIDTTNSLTDSFSGNCDCYIIGDGTKVATELELKSLAETTLDPESKNSVSGKAFADVLYTKVVDGEISISNNYTFTGSKYISASTGKAMSGGSTWKATLEFIPIANWYSVVIGSTGGTSSAAAVAFYSSNSESSFISSSPCATATTVQIPPEAKYARFSKANSQDCHTVITFQLVSKITSIENQISALGNDVENNYEKKSLEVDYLSSVVSGKAYKSSGIGTTIVSSSNASFYYAKVPCKKGDIFGIIARGHQNAFPAIITDANDIVLWQSGGTSGMWGGVLEVAPDNAAYLYISSYNETPAKLTKLAVKAGDTIIVDSSYAKTGMLAITNSFGSYSGCVGIAIPMLMQKGDVAKIKFKSYQNYRGYLLRNADGTMAGYLSDTDLAAETLFCWNGDNDVYLYVNGVTDYPPSIIKYSKSAAIALKNYGKRMVALGDSITSYDASDIGELVRGHLGMAFLKTSTQVDFGNIAEGNATICNWSNTTDSCEHNSAAVSGTYVNRTLPNEVLQLLQHITAEGEQISWHINSDNSDHSLATSVATGAGYTDDIPDLIYIAMGTNDSVTTDDFDEVIAQTYSQLTKLTICSALRWCLETLQNVFPTATIVCVTPIKRGTRSTAEMEAKCELIKKMCNYMAIPVVDGYNISGYSPLSYGLYSSDQIHPNTYTRRIARSIAAQVDALC